MSFRAGFLRSGRVKDKEIETARGGTGFDAFRRAGKGKTMIATPSIGRNRAGSAGPENRHAPRPEGFSPVNILAGGVHGILPPQFAGAPGSRSRGLGRIEDKRSAPKGRVYVTFGGVDSLAALWISVPFAAVFVLGCMTLA
jgi:hypothetical protein